MSEKDREREREEEGEGERDEIYGNISLSNDGPGWRSWGAEVGAIVGEIPCPGNERQRDEAYIMQRFVHPFLQRLRAITNPLVRDGVGVSRNASAN